MKLPHIYICIALCAVLSCQTRNDALETALKLAGDNRPELEKVLRHYSQHPADSLKLKAAKFLIENMPGHYTPEDNFIDACRQSFFSDSIGTFFSKRIFDISLNQIIILQENTIRKEDINYIKGDYLIHHINKSFELLELPWLQDLPFDLFLEYLLPYRFENEVLTNWRDSLTISPESLVHTSNNDEAKHSIKFAKHQLSIDERQHVFNEALSKKLLGKNIFPICYSQTQKEMFLSRIVGIPSAIDYIPHYANRNGSHFWQTIIIPEEQNQKLQTEGDRRAAKIYRRTYSHNPIPTPKPQEYIPELFQNPFNKDVTDLYLNTKNISIPIIFEVQEPHPSYAYLCVFNNLNWQPIAVNTFNNKHIAFEKMGTNIVYLPIIYKEHQLQPLNYPFILNRKGQTKFLIPDTTRRQKLHLTRKYPFSSLLALQGQKIEGVCIEVSNDPLFRKSDTLLTLHSPHKQFFAQVADTNLSFRFARILTRETYIINIAELIFIGKDGQVIQGCTEPSHANGIDQNPLTYTSIHKTSPLIIDFGEKINVSQIVCLPRGDGNGIYPGNEYELFYFAQMGWQSLGRKKASDYYIEYENVPNGALYWLRNRTTGIEERIFTYENEEIQFW